MKVRLHFGLAVGLTCLLGTLALMIGHGSVLAINGFSPNQELPLPLPPGNPAFAVPRGLEPGVTVDQQGTIYVISIRGVPGGADLFRWSPVVDPTPNIDGTLPFQSLGQPDACGIFACNLVGIAEGGGDADTATGFPALNQIPNLAITSQTLVPGETSIRSTDRGNTFSMPNVASNPIVGEDREWMASIDANTVYMAVHDAATFNINVFRSTDGGLDYLEGFGQAVDPQTSPVAGGVPATNTANIAGQLRVDRSQCPTRGNLYTIFVAPETVQENLSGAAIFRSAYIGVSKDAKLGLLAYTFTDHKIFTGPAQTDPNPAGKNNANLFPALAVDHFGFLYAVWSDNSNIFYSVSSDTGNTWTPATIINQAETVGKANVFPWVDADANGHVVVAWFGADQAGDSNVTSVMAPCTCSGDFSCTCMLQWANWNVYVAETINGHDPSPSFTQRIATDHVNHRGTLSTGGLTGGANRNMGDFFKVALDPQHRANISFGDDHNVHPLCNQPLPGPGNGHCGVDDPRTLRKIRAYFTRQQQTTPGIVTTGACAGAQEGEEEDEGEGEDDNHDHASFVDKKQPQENGTLIYNDPSQNLNLQSSNGVHGISYSGSNCVSFSGKAKVNGQLGYQFTFTACDLSALGTGIGNFSISVTGPLGFAYQKSGTFTSGFVNLHVKL